MARSAKQKTSAAVSTAADRAPKVPMDGAVHVTENDIAQRAYELYLARDCEPGHQLEDWLQAEHELRQRSVANTA